jgi:hypothetical protein
VAAIRHCAPRPQHQDHRQGEGRHRGRPACRASPAAGQDQDNRHQEHVLRLHAGQPQRDTGQHRPPAPQKPPVEPGETHDRQGDLAQVDGEQDRAGREQGEQVSEPLPAATGGQAPPADQEHQHQRQRPQRQAEPERQGGEGDREPGDHGEVHERQRAAIVGDLSVEPPVVHRRPAVLEADPGGRDVVAVVEAGAAAQELAEYQVELDGQVHAEDGDREPQWRRGCQTEKPLRPRHPHRRPEPSGDRRLRGPIELAPPAARVDRGRGQHRRGLAAGVRIEG